MADLDGLKSRATYAGLLSQTYACIGISVFCLVLSESIRRIPRRRARGPASAYADDATREAIQRSLEANLISEQEAETLQRLQSREGWITGYLYLGRCWSALPSPPHPKWPLQWVAQVLKLSEDHFLALAGVDAAVYVRFLRGCFYFTLLHSCTTLVVILPIHYIFATPDIKRSDITRGSIGSISNANSPPKAVRLLWVHMGMLFWITVTWMATLGWFLAGVLRFRAIAARNAPAPVVSGQPQPTQQLPAPDERKAMLANEKNPEAAAAAARRDPAQEDQPDYSLRCRTVLVTNIPQYMRSEVELKEYFREFLPRVTSMQDDQGVLGKIFGRRPRYPSNQSGRPPDLELQKKSATEGATYPPQPRFDEERIENVTIVPKLSALAKLVAARERDLEDLEMAHIALARNVIRAVRRRTAQLERERQAELRKQQGSERWWDDTFIARVAGGSWVWQDDESEDFTALDTLVQALQPFVEAADRREAYYSTWRRLRRWVSVVLFRQTPTMPEPAPSFETSDNIWDVLLSLPREILVPYQPQTRTRHGALMLLPFNTVIDAVSSWLHPHQRRWIEHLPTIDLAFSRLNMHTDKIEQFRARDIKTITPASSAFVTFKRWEDARRATRGLPHHPWRPLTCIVQQAPQYEDVDWRRIVKGKFPAQFLRDWIVAALIWLFQIFWLIPISGIIALVSVQNLTTIIPGLSRFFQKHDKIQTFVTGLLPTAIVVILGILVPVILFLIGRKGQTEVTWSGLHNGILIRYYKWAIINLLIFFCLGSSALNSILENFNRSIQDPFLLVSRSFPAAAPFYAGWFILQTSVQSAMQLGLVGLPLLQYIFSVRSADNPRKRLRGTRPRTIDYHYWVPNHLLAIHIIVVFAILNPLVIPVALLYFGCANIVFRNQLLRVYARRLYEGNGKVIAIRIMRYSLDGLGLAHIVFLAYNLLRVQNPVGNTVSSDKSRAALSGTLFGLTMIIKIVATRIFRSRYARVEDAEFARVSGQDELFPGMAQCGEPDSQNGEPSPISPSDTASLRATSLRNHRRHSTDDILHFRTPTDARAPAGLMPWQASMYVTRNPLDVMRRKQARLRRHQHRKSTAGSMTMGILEQPDEERVEGVGSGDSGDNDSISTHGAHQQWDQGSKRRPILDVPFKFAQRFMPAPRSSSNRSDNPDNDNDYVGNCKPETSVTPHPKLIPWDDTPDSSRPYDNPYYDDLADYLWLPRDPFTVIDLDDTVELRRVILSSLRDEDDDEELDVDTTTALPIVPEIPAPEPVLISPTSRAAVEGMEMRPLTSSPTRMSMASSPSLSDHDASPHGQSTPTIRRPASSSEMLGLGSPPRRPSYGDALSVGGTRSTRRIPSGERVPGSMDGLASPRSPASHHLNLTAANVLGVWQQRNAESASITGAASSFSRRSSGHSGRTQSRLHPSWQTRNAIEARIREESQREDHTLRQHDQEEEEEDTNAERAATAARWTSLRRLMVPSRPHD
ncbi:hypothetical protein EXIGLDRAFT_749824 [Exidia glandulosa HHB12029]|uniref:DUF221-domain-containing protein n=1 Tax=Exidia glandulosa HHB12029 TaxID=1314781 RepID=A0A165HKC9_EXIGL|nr:hypothetical protein EXIGLDRAFT_749824 [Exidia glandulosa HHB12029]